MAKLTHQSLCELGARYVKFLGYERILVQTGYRKENPDVFAINKYGSVLIECKVTRSDFLADTKKPFRQDPKTGIGAFRFYLVTEGVAKQEDMPKGWQLLIAKDENTIELPFPYYFGLNLSTNEKLNNKERNYKAELDLLWSWEYRKDHKCMPEISDEKIKFLHSAEERALKELEEIGQEAFRNKYYPEEKYGY